MLTPLYQTLTPLRRSAKPASGAAFTPTQVAGLKLWLKADGVLWQDSARTTAAAADADPVGAWDDASGVGNHVAQATSTKRPTLKLAVQNGKPALRFDNADDFLTRAAVGLGAAHTVFAAAACSSWAGGDDQILADTPSPNVYPLRQLSGSLYYSNGGFVNRAHGLTGSGWHQVACWRSGTTVRFYADGVQAGADTALGANTAGSFSSVGAYTDTTAPFGGDMGEVLVYDSALSTADRQSVEAYLKTRWATP